MQATKNTGKSISLAAKKKKKRKLKKYLGLYLMALPAMIYIFINNYMPLFGMQIAFRKLDYSKGVFRGDFVGLKNFEFLFSTRDAFIMIRNTVLYNLLFIVVGTVLGLAMAILFNEIKSKKLSRIYQSSVLIPYFISMVVVSYLAFSFLSAENGFINNTLLRAFGKEDVSWYAEPKYWPYILLFIHMWKGIGYSILMYTARLITINDEYYEAATLDGASKWQKVWRITLPMLKPVMIMMFILALGRMFYSDFGLFYQIPMGSGQLYNVTTTIDTYSFRALMKIGDITKSTATGVFQSLVGFILILLANMTIRKISKEDALF
ncbi:MAG: ABC transporter permease subunit [Eubacteriales bacterium]|jgi:putative aldouronate transport system permease protein|nr:ABC transporter permease subunit [Eubacteriales bacterium]MDD3198234.1 ABC transporter permease subunit [Eubacteriales bacterium]MDD3504475.1 ABC transporter permease subunit [Eubacteriales bacterium]MDD4683265.1 ABC transporter permease subunit [Eubacteriales bacterium]